MNHTKIVPAVDLDFPRQELSVRGLGFVVALPVCLKINCLSLCTREQSIYSMYPNMYQARM